MAARVEDNMVGEGERGNNQTPRRKRQERSLGVQEDIVCRVDVGECSVCGCKGESS